MPPTGAVVLEHPCLIILLVGKGVLEQGQAFLVPHLPRLVACNKNYLLVCAHRALIVPQGFYFLVPVPLPAPNSEALEEKPKRRCLTISCVSCLL